MATNYTYTIKDMSYDENTAMSTVTINTRLGEFTGWSRLHDVDRNVISEAGFEYAQNRAVVKFMKAIVREVTAKRDGVKEIYDYLLSCAEFDEDSRRIRKIRKKIFEYDSEIKRWKELIESNHETMLQYMEARNEERIALEAAATESAEDVEE